MGVAAWWLFLAACCSVAWDAYTYPRRQDEWERAHPGQNYIPGYKKLMRQDPNAHPAE